MAQFNVTPLPDGLEIRMAASLSLVDDAVDAVKSLCMEKGFTHGLFAIIITMREGLTNAVRHGAMNSDSQPVRFAIMFGKRTIRMEFEDKGPGFDWASAIETIAPSNSEGGRGLEIIRRYCHSVVYSDNGRQLHITIRT